VLLPTQAQHSSTNMLLHTHLFQSDVPKDQATPAASESSLAALSKDILSGAASGVAITFVGHPLDTIKTRLQAQSGSRPLYSGTWDCARATFQQEGLRGLYKVLLAAYFEPPSISITACCQL
jgi:hypothetical protein